MKHHRTLLAPLAILSLAAACQSSTRGAEDPHSDAALRRITAPVARIEPQRLEAHGDVRIDNYYWLREREDPRVIAYLEEENAYAEAQLAPTSELQEELYGEFISRIQEDDETVHQPDGPFLYYSRTFAGKAYPAHFRRPRSGGPEELLFDVNALAKGHGYYALASRTPSPDHARMAYAIDTVGRRIYDIEIKHVERGDIERSLSGTSGNMAWGADDMHLYYVRRDPVTLRAFQVWRHRLETPQAMDELVFEETDEEFSCGISRSRSDRFLMITSNQTLTTETRVLDLEDASAGWRVVLPREVGHEYEVDHLAAADGDRFLIRTNKDAENFRIVTAPLDDPSNWTELVSHRIDTLVEGVEAFAGHIVSRARGGGLVHVVVRPPGAGAVAPDG